MSKKVIIYTSDTCGYCHLAKDYLNEIGAQFEEKNISRDKDARKELMTQGFMGVPIIDVEGEVVQGFDKIRLDELLK